MKILAISGKRGAGKDTLANFLVRNEWELFGYPCAKLGLADPIKDDIAQRFGGNMDIMHGPNAAKEQRIPGTQMSYRNAMRVIGKAYTDIEPIHFARRLIERAQDFRLVVVNDMRLLNEAKYLKAHGAKIIRLTRAENPDDTHVTETELDDWDGFDAVVHNGGMTVAQTQRIVVHALYQWGWLRRDYQW